MTVRNEIDVELWEAIQKKVKFVGLKIIHGGMFSKMS